MSIRSRLILSYIAMVVVPIVLFIIAGLLIMAFFRGDIRELTSLLPESHNYKQTVSEDTELFNDIKETSMVNPVRFNDSQFLSTVQGELNKTGSFLIVRQGEEILFSADEVDHIAAGDLPEFGYHSSDNNIEEINNRTYSIKQHDFYLPEKGLASIFLIKDASVLVSLTQTFYPLLFTVLLLILVVTNGILTYYVSRSIVKPIHSLKSAAQKIKEGKLNHSIDVKGKDELTELAQTFEAMRLQLKESATVQAQYEENRKELIAHISHDLKTPITSIKGYIEGILDGVTTSPEMLNRYIQTIYQKSNDLDHLIDELFLYSKLDLKKVPFSFEIVDVKDYLLDYVEELGFELEKKRVDIHLHYHYAACYQVHLDRDKIKRVFSNIIDNSLKYMDKEKGVIHIELALSEGQVKIEIADNGPGIPSEAIPYIFHQFYRAEQSRNKQTGGSGLGLAIARMIVEEHGGKIAVESGQDIGTKIMISLRKVSE